jgi:septum formation protein
LAVIRNDQKLRLILASGSPYRLQLLRDAGYDVIAIPSHIPEPDLATFADLESGLAHLAQLKARAVFQAGAAGLILAADTVSLAAGKLLGKPADRGEARGMLQALSGTTHEVLTGWCLLRTRDQLALCGTDRTTITMRPWTPDEIAAYLDGGEWEGKCGAYGLEIDSDPFVTEIVGSAANVIGLPLERLQAVLAEFPKLAEEP